jgi:DNA primase small subunit
VFYQWLSYGDQKYFERREWSFTLPDDIYIRYKCFDSAEKLKSGLIEGTRDLPIKIDIGAVYNEKPSERAGLKANLIPVEKEVVFDIDISDYDDVRFCGCSGSAICKRCWSLMNAAAKVIDTALRSDFGFK